MEPNQPFPSGVIIGAQKSGTTFLSNLLEQYPDIQCLSPGEPHFFTKEFERGWDWYRSLQTSDKTITFEKSTTYTFLRPPTNHPGFIADHVGLTAPVPQRLHEANPNMRLIYIMRDPVKRTVSAAQHYLRFNPNKSIDDLIREDPMLRIPSFYSAQIGHYLSVFPKTSFLFLSAKKLYADPLDTARTAAIHFGTEHPDFQAQVAVSQNEKYQVHPAIHWVMEKLSFGKGARSLNQALANTVGLKPLRAAIRKQLSVDPPTPSQETIEWLTEQFAGERERVRELVGFDFEAD